MSQTTPYPNCRRCGNALLFSSREFNDGLCHYCAHKENAQLRERQCPIDINADGKAIGIQVGHRGHKIWLCADGQAIVRINRASNVVIDDMRELSDV